MSADNSLEFHEYGDIYAIGDQYEIPSSVTIEVGTACNLRCQHCYIPNHGDSALSYETIMDLFRQLRELGTFEIILTGGEILYRDDALQIIESGRKMGFDIGLFSNGTLVNEAIAEELAKLHINMFSTSVYSLNASVHDQITKCAGSLKKTLNGLSLLKKYNIPIEVKSMIMKQNAGDMMDLWSYCKENRFRFVASPFIFCQSDRNKKPLDLRVHGEELKRIIPSIDEIVSFAPANRDPEDYICPSMHHSFGINAFGEVSPCNALFYSIGNIYQSSLKDLWFSEDAKRIRNVKFKDISDCINCKSLNYCIRCPGISLGETNDMFSKYDYACEIANARRSYRTNP